MGEVILGYTTTKNVLSSVQYQHAKETVWLWQQGTSKLMQDTSSIFAQRTQITALRDTLL
jgi:hypothetical protein